MENHLKEKVIRHISRLEDFLFDIGSMMRPNFDRVHFPTNEEIRCPLTDLTKYPIPYSSMKYEDVSNNFVSEFFSNIRHVTYFDERS